jgi:hypothetical protein
MRRLILELTEQDLSQLGIEIPLFQHIKSIELLHFLRQDWEEFAAIWRVEFKDFSFKAKDLLSTGMLAEVQVLEQEKNGAYTVFIRGGPILSSVLNSLGVVDGYLFPPLAIRDGKIKISFLGSPKQVETFLQKMDDRHIKYRVMMLSEATFGPDSPLNQLTEKQRQVLTTAYRLGYYDIPRRITTDQLAEKLRIGNSTCVEHLRKAERRLLVQVLTRGTDFWLDEPTTKK